MPESGEMVTRRTFLAGSLGAGITGGLGGLIGCGGHNRATGFSGYAFIANQEGGAIAAVDLEVFAVARHIRVDGSPTAVVANPGSARVYALTPGNGSVHEIGAGNLTFARKLQVAATALEMRLSPAGDALYVLCQKTQAIGASRFGSDADELDSSVAGRSGRLRYLTRRKQRGRQLRRRMLHYFHRSGEPA